MVFEAYFDESGTGGNSPAMVVAGAWAPVKKWAEFERRWERELVAEKLTHFHMVDCTHFKKEFKGWNTARRDGLLKRLIAIIGETVEMAATAGIVIADHDELHEKFKRALPLYETCAYQALHMLACVVPPDEKRNKTAVIFESAPKTVNSVKKAYDLANSFANEFPYARELNDKPFSSLTFAEKREKYPLQAADLIAWESAKALRSQLGVENRPMRGSLVGILGSVQTYATLIGREHFKQYVGAWLREFRRRSARRIDPPVID